MTNCTKGVVTGVVMFVAGLSTVGRAQAPVAAARVTSGDSTAMVSATVLGRRIALALERVTLDAALDSIATHGRVRMLYSRTRVPVDRVVSLVVDSITVGDALTVLLRGTGVSVTVSAGGALVLDRIANGASEGLVVDARARTATGSISGSVTDSLTHGTVAYVLLKIDETGQSVRSGADGHYVLADVAPGDYHVTARRVGFVAKTRTVTVRDSQVVRLDFVLNQPPTKLDEVVTTALGDQHRYEVGNDIATINVDSVAPTAPATSVTDIITSRAPGVQVVESGGLAGSGNAIRIRGQSSMLLQGDPIIIVDGVRQDNTPGGTVGTVFSGGVPSPNRLNDIDFTQVETIDILKGPSASTEYGTDAANGVIVITTKRGTAGKPQWNTSAEQDGSGIPSGFPQYYYSWGHLTDGSRAPVQCPVLPIDAGSEASNGPPFNIGSSLGTCVVDSVTHFNPLADPYTSVFGPGLRSKYDLSVGGGTGAIRFYFGGALSNELGTVRLPTVFRPEALANGIPSSEFHPNTLDQRSLRGTTTFQLGATADLTVTTAYLSTFSAMPAEGLVGVSTGSVVLDDSAHQYGYEGTGNSISDRFHNPIQLLGNKQDQQTDRFTGGVTASWRPLAWLSAHATVGIDHGSQNLIQDQSPQSQAFAESSNSANGSIGQTQIGTDIYSADVRTSAIASPFSWLRLTTSLGFQLADTRTSGIAAFAQTTLAMPTLTGAPGASVTQLSNRSATVGGYIEEGFSLFNSLYWATALRLDAGSGFGQAIRDAAYPKFDLSFPVLKNDPTTLRLRVALGAAGRQPTNGADRLLYDITQPGYLNGGNVGTGHVIAPGNPELKPERSMEYEGGVDLGLWNSRVTLGVTGYWRSTTDALIDQTLGFDLAQWTYEENIGDIRNSGIEASLSALLLQTRLISWSVTVSVATNHDKLVRIDSGFTQALLGYQRQVVGYPLYGFWNYRYHYTSPSHSGILQANQVAIDTSVSYLGSSIPTQEGALDTRVGFLHGLITVGALFSYGGGFKVLDLNAAAADRNLNSEATNDPHAPLWQQARAIAGSGNILSGYFVDGTFLRLRELSLTYVLPSRWAHLVRAHSLSITGAARNLALWARLPGIDPEVSNLGTTTSITGSTTVNNDLRSNGASAVPLARAWFLRVNAGW